MSFLPREKDYSEKEYLTDAARAFGHKLRHTQRSYFPPYGGVKIPWTVTRVIKYVLVTGLILLFVALWLNAVLFPPHRV